MAAPERHAPKLARMRTASGRPKLCLCAMFLFVYELRPSCAVCGDDERVAPIAVHGTVFTCLAILAESLLIPGAIAPIV